MNKSMMGALALVLGLAASAGLVSAYGFEKNEAVREAIETGDFDAWREAMKTDITEENFDRLQERFHEREQMKEHQEAIDQAIGSGDYGAWILAIEEMRESRQDITKIITEENFEKYAEFHEAIKEKDIGRAAEIADELEIDNLGCHMFGNMKPGVRMGFNRGFGPGPCGQ